VPRLTLFAMAQEPKKPQPAEPQEPPVTDPQPYTDPGKPPPADPQEDRPMRDPMPPGSDVPRSLRLLASTKAP